MIRVVIAEDESPIARELNYLIRTEDPSFKIVKHVLNGKEGISFFESESADVIFTDINMPVVDGFELLSYVKKNHPSIVCVILTGFSEFSYAKKAISLGVVEYLLKPVDAAELSSLLGRIKTKIATSTDCKERSCPGKNDIAALKTYASSKVEREMLLLKIDKFLRDNFNKPINTKQLGDIFGFVPSYLSKLYREFYGLSPMEYVTQLRIERAKALINESEVFFVRDVARLVGYDDPLYFSKLFRKSTGYSPSDYRKMYKQ